MSTSSANRQLYGEDNGFNQWISGQVAMITGTPLSHTTSHFHDEVDEGPATPGDDDDDEDDKDKVSVSQDSSLVALANIFKTLLYQAAIEIFRDCNGERVHIQVFNNIYYSWMYVLCSQLSTRYIFQSSLFFPRLAFRPTQIKHLL